MGKALNKAFRINWYAAEALIGLAKLSAVEIAVLIQICNMIYTKNGPIEDDARHIGKQCNLGRIRTQKIINDLIERGEIYKTNCGKISQHRCEKEIEDYKKRVEDASKNGKFGAEKKKENKRKQDLDISQAEFEEVANTRTYKLKNIEPVPDGIVPRPYKVEFHLTDRDCKDARLKAPGWDLYHLMRLYDEWVNEKGTHIHSHGKAFMAWVSSYTRGKPPSHGNDDVNLH